MLRSSKLEVPWMLKPCSLAKCSRHIKHRCGEISLIVEAAVQSLGKLDKRFRNDTFCSSSSYVIPNFKNQFSVISEVMPAK